MTRLLNDSLGNHPLPDYSPAVGSKEMAVSKKLWRKPEVRRIAAGSAESSTTSGSDGAATAPKKS